MQNYKGTGRLLSFTETEEKTPLYYTENNKTPLKHPHQLRKQYMNAIDYIDRIINEYNDKQSEILHRMEHTTYSASWGYIELKELQDLRIYRRRAKQERKSYFEMIDRLRDDNHMTVIFNFLKSTNTLSDYLLYKEDIRERYPVFPLVESSKEKWNQEVRDKQI